MIYSSRIENVLQNAAQVQLLNGNGNIDENISYEITGARSPNHQVFWIRDGKEIIFYGADDAPPLHQMKHKFAANNFDGKEAMELRQEWWERGHEEDWTFFYLFYHDVKHPFFKATGTLNSSITWRTISPVLFYNTYRFLAKSIFMFENFVSPVFVKYFPERYDT